MVDSEAWCCHTVFNAVPGYALLAHTLGARQHSVLDRKPNVCNDVAEGEAQLQ